MKGIIKEDYLSESASYDRLIEEVKKVTSLNDSYKNVLRYVDAIVDYYIRKPKEKNVRYPIIYIPESGNDVKYLCEVYLFLKMALVHSTAAAALKTDWDYSKMSPEEQKETNKIRKRKQNIKGLRDPNCVYHKSMVWVCTTEYRKLRKDVLVDSLCQTNEIFLTDNCVADFEDNYGPDIYGNVNNLFLFPINNRDSSITFCRSSISSWKSVNNCFVFVFDTSNFQLHHIYDKARVLCDIYPQQSYEENGKVSYSLFITLTKEECNTVFSRPANVKHFMVKVDTPEKDCIIDMFSHGFYNRHRNILSLCLDESACKAFSIYINNEIDSTFAGNLYYQAVLKVAYDCLMSHNEEMTAKIKDFSGESEIGVVIDCYCPEKIKQALGNCLKERGIKFTFYTYNDLKKVSGRQNNGINENKIVVLLFIPHVIHRIDMVYNCYPNSFDGYYLNSDQQLLEITNDLTTCDFYSLKNKYNYKLNALLSSEFRKEAMFFQNFEITNTDNVWSLLYSVEDQVEYVGNSSGPVMKLYYDDNSRDSISDTEWLIYTNKGDNRMHLQKARVLYNTNSFDNIDSVQRISKLADETVDIFIKESYKGDSALETKIIEDYIAKRRNQDIDINKDIPIWKYMIKEKIETLCISKGIVTHDEVERAESTWDLLRYKLDDERFVKLYDEIGVSVRKEYFLQFWCNVLIDKPIIPDEKEKLLNLGLERGIIDMYVRKQRKQKLETKSTNNETEKFLRSVLFRDLTDDILEEIIQDNSMSEILPTDSKDNIKALKEIAESQISLKKLKSYKYEENNA